MKPIGFPEQTVVVVYAKDQPEYLPLPAFSDSKVTISCWRLSIRERLRLLFTGRIWLQQINFGGPPQPQKPQIESPFAGKEGGA